MLSEQYGQGNARRFHGSIHKRVSEKCIRSVGDHSWRIFSREGLGPEELSASDGGQFDDRPAYVVKLAHQNAPARIDTPFAALRTRDLFDNLLTGRISTSQQLASWAQQVN
jgi:hypothetical protein